MRLYLDGEWFDAVPSGALYEHEFERLLMQDRNDLFPGFRGARFDPLLVTPLGNVQPDMILIDTDYRSIFVVEVELASHSLVRHVSPQIERIAAARLGDKEAEWLATHSPEFDKERLRSLFRDVSHSTVLLVNAPTPHWDDGLRSLPGIYRAVVEVFRSRRSRTLLRINGVQPESPGDIVSSLAAGMGHLNCAFKMEVASALDPSVVFLDALLEGESKRFRVKVLGADRYLFLTPTSIVPPGRAQLLRSVDGNYRIEVLS